MSDYVQPIIRIVRLPDGRIAVENARDQSGLTQDELREIPKALQVWWKLMWETHFPGETMEVNF